MATSPIYSWPEPDNTDLVKNGALAIRTAVNAIDTSMSELLGGTTGQVLSKTSNTNMDFTWVTTDDANAIQNAIVDAKGDIIAASANDTPARLAVGANDLLVTAASGEATGLKYTGAWTTWTPTWTNVTIGNAVVTARYCQIGKVVFCYIAFKHGSTTSITGNMTWSNPVTSGGSWGSHQQTNTTILDAGVAYYNGMVTVAGANSALTVALVSGTYPTLTNTSATVPMTWTTNDEFWASYFYEVA